MKLCPGCARHEPNLKVQGDIPTRFSYAPGRAPDGQPVILVVDETGELGGRSVTNAAEQVIEYLSERLTDHEGGGMPFDAYRVLYRDTIPQWDELEHDGAKFTGFAPLSDIERKQCAKGWAELLRT